MLNLDTFREVLTRKTSLLLTLLVMASPGVISATVPDCANVEALQLDADLRGYASERDHIRFFSLEVPSPGIVSLDIMTAGENGNPAKIDLSSHGCSEPARAKGVKVLEQSPDHLVLAVRTPGTWWVRAAAQGPYRLITSFTPAQVRDETFESVSGLRTFLTRTDFHAAVTMGKVEQEIVDPDPGTLVFGAPRGRLLASFLTLRPVGLAAKVEQEIVDPDPGTLRTTGIGIDQVVFHEAVCPPAHRQDDHGDIMSCATPLVLGRGSAGILGNDWHDDVDVFVLSSSEIVSIEIATAGTTDTFVALYDRFGQRLAIDDDGGEGRSSRILATLAPGRYFVRVSGAAGAEGAYELTTTTR